MDRLRKHLLYLAIGEFSALCVFAILYRALNLGMASLVAFLCLLMILLQGSLYWLYRYGLLLKGKPIVCQTIKFWRMLRYFDTVSLVIAGVMIPFVHMGRKDSLWAIGVFAFAIIEYINYFWYRLSYGRSGFSIKVLLKTKLRKSSINKLIGKD